LQDCDCSQGGDHPPSTTTSASHSRRKAHVIFDPQLIAKYQRRFLGFDDKIVSMYARGMSTREIVGHLRDLYGIEVSPDLISTVTDAVLEEVATWQARPLETTYPLIFFDALRVKIRDEGTVRNKAVHIALGVRADGTKEILGLWLEQNEGAKFWLRVMNELKNRGVEDVLIAVVDGLEGFPEAITAVFPQAMVQTCIVHLLRHSLDFVSWKDRKPVAAALKGIPEEFPPRPYWRRRGASACGGRTESREQVPTLPQPRRHPSLVAVLARTMATPEDGHLDSARESNAGGFAKHCRRTVFLAAYCRPEEARVDQSARGGHAKRNAAGGSSPDFGPARAPRSRRRRSDRGRRGCRRPPPPNGTARTHDEVSSRLYGFYPGHRCPPGGERRSVAGL
jgi:hypothetical protein